MIKLIGILGLLISSHSWAITLERGTYSTAALPCTYNVEISSSTYYAESGTQSPYCLSRGDVIELSAKRSSGDVFEGESAQAAGQRFSWTILTSTSFLQKTLIQSIDGTWQASPNVLFRK
jgi:hypothetical protein